ncbi:hypothetical protein Sjap_013131 [Stephania japonica]|uniref:SOSEKI DIX-like domain-containing protein n=1 Tax=Stephania japonica TaxID=461633 RepID=A0AAP0IXC3_9MAGN
MAVSSSYSSSFSGRTELLEVPNKFRDRETSPERTKIWAEQRQSRIREKKVPIVYYLCRDGHLEQPHFMEVPISSSNQGLYLRDVINRLNSLRGKGIASMYSWSSKRSYKNGFVWHDLSESDFIYPVHGQEYVLKGSEIIQGSAEETEVTSESEFPMIVRRRNQSWSSDAGLHEYKVYQTTGSNGDHNGRAADASTQTATSDDKRRRRRATIREEEQPQQQQQQQHEEEEEEEEEDDNKQIVVIQQEQHHQTTTELSREEISPPPSSPSPETLESLIKADGRIVRIPRAPDCSSTSSSDIRDRSTANDHPSGRIKASAVLMQLISCGSLSVKESCSGGPTAGLSLVSQYKARLPRGAPDQLSSQGRLIENPSFGGFQVEDKEYFSGSLIETKKDDEFPVLKRSSSYNAADRSSSKLELKEEIDGVRAKCIPRMPKASARKNEIRDY